VIPKKLHRIWFGQRPMPEAYNRFWDDWQRLHPDWTLITWTEGNLPPLINGHLWEHVGLTAHAGIPMAHERAVAVQRADIVAYELVWRYGGVYVNCDMQPLRSLDPLLEHKAFAAKEDHHYLCNAVMGGEKESPFFAEVISQLPSRFGGEFQNERMEIQTGPHLLTAVAEQCPDMITVLSRESFYFAHHGSLQYGEDASAFVDRARANGAYALHHWGHRKQEGDR
jgi:mannosyltransferase OCH1-like enzyme